MWCTMVTVPKKMVGLERLLDYHVALFGLAEWLRETRWMRMYTRPHDGQLTTSALL